MALPLGRYAHQVGSAVILAAPAPLPTGNTALSTFDGLDPNGDWRLFVVDEVFSADGAVSGGWELTITAEVDV